ncbi:hypothetical protein [Aequorivita antarctica]|uniref:Uncharacterized protein n=1 Tax=Aequorivita antarctica TaxID=153266 RepID=A0A5C6YWT1_9FLAO|nr:hypothetical protein [Aequorivita antarctica]TXD72060.1 hypothetical protein ESU54_13455 [Aequorivita antarctica]SRX75666.1 hypothetical protein AEQU3_02662 [Aequorivita antarctica]
MEEKEPQKKNKLFMYVLWALVGYIGILTGYHSFKIIEYFIKPVPNPLMPLDLYKYIAFPYLSIIPFLFGLLFLGIYFIKKKYVTKGYAVFYGILILLLHISQNSLFEFFNSFNPYGG